MSLLFCSSLFVAGGPLGPNVGMLQSEGVQEPMAANAMLGGSFGSAW